MQDNHTTSGSHQPDVDQPTIEQVLTEAARELPLLTLAGCLTVIAEVLPYALGRLRPVCSFVSADGEHTIPTQFVWKDLETGEVYCHLRCAALAAIDKARQISDDEGLVTRFNRTVDA